MTKHVKGLEQLTKKLDRLSKPELYEKALSHSALLVEVDAKKLAPVSTGILRQSINTKIDKGKMEATVGTPLKYAPYIEYGTGIYSSEGTGRKTPWTFKIGDGWVTTEGQRPQPFLGPALRQNKKKIAKHFKDVVAKEIKK